jgi:hypothetical protein
MMLISTPIGLTYHLTASRFAGKEWRFWAAAGLFSPCFGLFLAYEIGVTEGLLLW